MAPRGDFFTFFLPTRIGEGYSQAPYAQKWPKFRKKSGEKYPPPGPPPKPLNIRWFNRETPEIPEKSRKIRKKWEFLGGGWGVGSTGSRHKIPPEKRDYQQKTNANVYFHYLPANWFFVGNLVFLGVFWGGIRYSLHVFSVRM